MFVLPVAVSAALSAALLLPVQASDASPVAYFDEGARASEDSTMVIDVLANDVDTDGDVLFIDPASIRVDVATADPGAPAAAPSDFTVSVVDGLLHVSPPTNFHGTIEGSYAATDRPVDVEEEEGRRSASTTFSGTFDPVNDAPIVGDVGSATSPIVGREEGRLTIAAPLRNTIDPEGDDVSLATVELADPSQGTVEASPIIPGAIVFVPAANVTGSVQILITATDGQAVSAPGTIWVELLNVNDAPTAADASLTTVSGSAAVVRIPASDSDGDSLLLSIASEPTLGSAQIVGDSLLFIADRSAVGSDRVTVVVSDPEGATATSEVFVTVEPKIVAVFSTGGCDSFAAVRGDRLSIEASQCAVADDFAPLRVVAGSATSSAGAAVSVSAAGVLTYTAPARFSGVDTISFTVDDGIGNRARITSRIEVTRWSTEFQGATGRTGDVVRTYAALLNRMPDAAGLEFWAGTGLDRTALARQFVNSEEFTNRFGNQLNTASNAQWVELVYQAVFERSADPGGAAFWQEQLRSGGIDRVELIVWFAHSDEFKAITRTT